MWLPKQLNPTNTESRKARATLFWELLRTPKEDRNERLLDLCYKHVTEKFPETEELYFATNEVLEHLDKRLHDHEYKWKDVGDKSKRIYHRFHSQSHGKLAGRALRYDYDYHEFQVPTFDSVEKARNSTGSGKETKKRKAEEKKVDEVRQLIWKMARTKREEKKELSFRNEKEGEYWSGLLNWAEM
ncbi:hypothetical protein NHQ30_007892 [Ciborinia camelliae]|nr:hypothetical protein NHQ30_007892 [Ciborinia camelliae]